VSRVVSIRVPAVLDRCVYANANRSNMLASQIVGLILEHSISGHYDFSRLTDEEFLDAKLDVRLADELVAKVRLVSKSLQVSVSVYIRTILYAYYSKRLVFVERDGHYTLEENHAQTAGA